MSPLFDSHVHLHAAGLSDATVDLALAQARDRGWAGGVLAGYGPAELPRAVELCRREPGLWWSAGLHPWWLAGHRDDATVAAGWRSVQAAVDGGAGVALGEFGLDRNVRGRLPLADQIRWFERGLQLGARVGLPIIIHLVGAWQQGRAALAPFARQRLGILHRYGGSAELIAGFEAMGLYVSLSVHHLRREPGRARAVAQAISADRLLIETDWDGATGSYPEAIAELTLLLERLATWRAVTPRQLARQVLANTQTIYDIAGPGGERP